MFGTEKVLQISREISDPLQNRPKKRQVEIKLPTKCVGSVRGSAVDHCKGQLLGAGAVLSGSVGIIAGYHISPTASTPEL